MVDQRDGIWRGRDGQELVDTGKDTASKEKERTPTPPPAVVEKTGAATESSQSATTAEMPK
jgi:hypothetical protein